ncbi:MAG: hypothetical protein L3J41_17775 [Melioribacteraceae bacterium]|nr:hypothetical protein [Melioribacteraceae bacterium]
MKRLIIISSLITLISSTTLLAQRNETHREWGRMGGKIEQLEKIKIIEELNFDEETAIRFFVRRNKHREKQKGLIEKRDLLYQELASEVNQEDEGKLKSKVDKIFEIESEMLFKRKEFLYSLNDFLTEKEIAQLILFEYNFRKEVRNQFMKQGRRRMEGN